MRRATPLALSLAALAVALLLDGCDAAPKVQGGTDGCTGCHGEDLAGHIVFEAPPMGRYAASNITPGGPNTCRRPTSTRLTCEPMMP